MEGGRTGGKKLVLGKSIIDESRDDVTYNLTTGNKPPHRSNRKTG